MSVTLKKDLRGLEDAAVAFSEVNMGGTAIGTGLNTVSACKSKAAHFQCSTASCADCIVFSCTWCYPRTPNTVRLSLKSLQKSRVSPFEPHLV